MILVCDGCGFVVGWGVFYDWCGLSVRLCLWVLMCSI